MPLVRSPRRNRVPLRRPGPHRLSRRPRDPRRRRMGSLPLLSRQREGPVLRTLGTLCGLPALVQRRPRHRDLPIPIDNKTRPEPGHRLAERRTNAMTEQFRTADGGRIDRATPLGFEFEGARYTGYKGDSLASALLANGVHEVTTSIKFGRPRGIAAAGSEDPNGLIQLETPFPDPMQLATMIEL